MKLKQLKVKLQFEGLLILFISFYHCNLIILKSTYNNSQMSYLNAQTLQRSILSKSMLVSDPVRIQQVENLENIPGLKFKTGNQDWANSQSCCVCKQPFNPNRNVNRHHCRVCAGSVCGECSRKKINNERACDLCFLKQYLKKQEHQRKEQFRIREQNIQKMNQQIKSFEQQIDNMEKEIMQVERTNVELQIKTNKELVERKTQIENKQKELKKQQEEIEGKKKALMEKKEQLETRQDRNKEYFSKVQIMKLEISSKQTSLLQKMQELQRLKAELEKLEIQKRQLMAELK